MPPDESPALLDRPILIGGVGRSGTTIMRTILARHSACAAAPWETRFMSDPGGVLDLLDALTVDAAGYADDVAIRRFLRMMSDMRRPRFLARLLPRLRPWLKRDLFGRYWPQSYGTLPLGETVGLDHFDATVARLIDTIQAGEFPGYWYGTPSRTNRPTIRQARYLPRSEVAAACAMFVSRMVRPFLDRAGASRFVEDTPTNAFVADRIAELFPDLRLIYMHRDPRDVISSRGTRSWGGKDVALSIDALRKRHDQWERVRRVLAPASFIEVRFEDFAADPPAIVRRLCEFAELDFEPAMLDLDLSKHHVGRYAQSLTPEQIAMIEAAMGPWMAEHGYRVG